MLVSTPNQKLDNQLTHNNSVCRMLCSFQTDNPSPLHNSVKTQALLTWCVSASITRRMIAVAKSLPTMPFQSLAAPSKHVLHGSSPFSMIMPHLTPPYVPTNHALRHHFYMLPMMTSCMWSELPSHTCNTASKATNQKLWAPTPSGQVGPWHYFSVAPPPKPS